MHIKIGTTVEQLATKYNNSHHISADEKEADFIYHNVVKLKTNTEQLIGQLHHPQDVAMLAKRAVRAALQQQQANKRRNNDEHIDELEPNVQHMQQAEGKEFEKKIKRSNMTELMKALINLCKGSNEWDIQYINRMVLLLIKTLNVLAKSYRTAVMYANVGFYETAAAMAILEAEQAQFTTTNSYKELRQKMVEYGKTIKVGYNKAIDLELWISKSAENLKKAQERPLADTIDDYDDQDDADKDDDDDDEAKDPELERMLKKNEKALLGSDLFESTLVDCFGVNSKKVGSSYRVGAVLTAQ